MSSKIQYIEIEGYNYPLFLNPPTDDPNLPSYLQSVCPKITEDLELIETIHQGHAKNLLKKWELESEGNFKQRQEITLFSNFLSKAIKTFPGFLSDIRNTDKLYPSLVDNFKNVDGKGNDFISFFMQADLEAIKSGFCGILVDCEKYSEFSSSIPYLVLLPRSDVLSWSQTLIEGQCKYERVTIKEYFNQKLGLFGSQQITLYKTFFDDGSYLTQVILDEDDKPVVRTIEEGQTSLSCVPLVFYSATEINPTEAVPPLEGLAKKNKAHYELYSEYRNIIFRLNNPAIVRTGLVTPGQTDFSKLPPVILSGSIALDVPIGGGMAYVEPTGKCLETDRIELDKLEESMTKDTLEFIFGGANKTATEIVLSSVASKANLSVMARFKQSVIEQVSELWGNYFGEYDTKGTCVVSQDLLNIPLSSQDMQALSGMVRENTLSNITFLELMNEGKRMPQGVTPSLEIKRITAQKIRNAKLETKPDKLNDDIKDA